MRHFLQVDFEIIATAITVGVMLLLVVSLPAMWRQEDLSFPAPGFWPYSEAVWESIARTAPLAPVWVLPGIVLVELGETGAARIVIGLWILAVWAVAARVIFYNRPNWVVPPALRHQPGLWERRSRGGDTSSEG